MNTPTPEKKNLEYVLYLSRNAKTLVNDSPECFNGLIKTLVVPLLDNREPLQTTKSLGNSIPPSSIGVTEVETSAAPLRDNREPLQTTFLMGNSIPPSSIGVTEAETMPPSSVRVHDSETIRNDFETSAAQLLDNREPLQTNFLLGNSIPPSSIVVTEAETIGASGIFRTEEKTITAGSVGETEAETIPDDFSLAFEGNTSIFDSDSAVSRCFGDRNNMYSGVFVGTEVDIGQLQLDKKQGKHYFY